MSRADKSQRRTLRAMGVTILGVILSVATTVTFGLPGPWWVRLVIGVAVAAALIAVVKLGTTEGGHGPIARAADWLTGESEDQSRP